MAKKIKTPVNDDDGNLTGYEFTDAVTGEFLGYRDVDPMAEVPIKHRISIPIFADNGALVGYDVRDRRTGKAIGWLRPNYKEEVQQDVEDLLQRPVFDQQLEKIMAEAATTETSSRLRKIEERLVDAPIGDRLDIKQAAAFLKVSVNTVRRRIRDGSLPAIKVGAAYQFKRIDLDRYLESQRRVIPPVSSTKENAGKKRKVNYDKIARNQGLGKGRPK